MLVATKTIYTQQIPNWYTIMNTSTIILEEEKRLTAATDAQRTDTHAEDLAQPRSQFGPISKAFCIEVGYESMGILIRLQSSY